MFTERDILLRVVATGRDPDDMRVAEAMTLDPCTVNTETSLAKALALMLEGNFRHLPVVDGHGRVIAMISMRDVPPVHQFMLLQWTTWTNGKVDASALT